MLSAGNDTVLMCGSAILGLDLTTGAPGVAGSEKEGGQRGLPLCESGIEFVSGFFQSVGGRLWFGPTETGLPLGSTWTTLSLSLDNAVIRVDVVVVVVGEDLLDVAKMVILVVGVVVVVVVAVVVVGLVVVGIAFNEILLPAVVVVVKVVVEGLVEEVVVVVVVEDVRMGFVVAVEEVRVVVVLLVVLDVGIIMEVVDVMGLVVILLVVVGTASSLAVAVVEVVDILKVLPTELVEAVVILAVVVIAALGPVEETTEKGVGEKEVEEWNTYGTPNRFFSSSSL